jgi:peptidoglycan hydrolase CwlO-like protein
MGKKLIVVALAVVAVAIVLKKTDFGRDVGSHIKHWWASTKKEANDEVSLKWEIERLTDEVNDLSSEDEKLVNQIAKEDVEIKKLKKKLGEMEETQQKHRDVVRTRVTTLQHVQQTNPSKNTTNDERLLESAVAMAKRGDEAIASHKTLIASRENRAAALRQQREELYTTKQELLNKLADLEAQVVILQTEQMKSDDPADNSRVARVRKSIEEVDTRIQVEKRKREVRGELTPPEKVSTPPAPKKDVLKDALNYLDGDANNAEPKEKVQK